jgi:hypothetical protein
MEMSDIISIQISDKNPVNQGFLRMKIIDQTSKIEIPSEEKDKPLGIFVEEVGDVDYVLDQTILSKKAQIISLTEQVDRLEQHKSRLISDILELQNIKSYNQIKIQVTNQDLDIASKQVAVYTHRVDGIKSIISSSSRDISFIDEIYYNLDTISDYTQNILK